MVYYGRARGYRTTPVPSAPAGPRAMVAKFPGHCAECHQPIEVGSDIMFSPGHTTHAVCPKPKRGQKKIELPTEEGMYQKGDDIFRVKKSQAGNLYAMKLTQIGGERLRDVDEVTVQFEFEYVKGAILDLSAKDRMTLEQAQAFGLRYGICCVCATPLKQATSVLLGIGPVCALQFGGQRELKIKFDEAKAAAAKAAAKPKRTRKSAVAI